MSVGVEIAHLDDARERLEIAEDVTGRFDKRLARAAIDEDAAWDRFAGLVVVAAVGKANEFSQLADDQRRASPSQTGLGRRGRDAGALAG